MFINIQDLLLIEKIALHGSFSKAAEHFHRTRSAITQQIHKIENQLGFPLFDRSSYRPQLTLEGQRFLAQSRPVLQKWQQFTAEVHHIKKGWETDFSIAIDDILHKDILFKAVEQFYQVNPQVTIHVHREILNGCWDALLENRASLAIGVTGEPPLEFLCSQQTMGTVEFAFVVACHHPLAYVSHPLSAKDLENFPCIVVSDTSQRLGKRSSGLIAQQPRLVVPSIEDKIRAQLLGIGIGYLPRMRIQSYLKSGQLVERIIVNQPPKKGFFKMAWRSDVQSPVLEWFLNYLNQEGILRSFVDDSPP